MVRTSINISKVTLFSKDFLNIIKSKLNSCSIDGKYLEIEITERMVMENEENINRIFMQLKEMSIEISIDDFGTGYSSLSYLHKLNIDRLKIDQSFVRGSNQHLQILSTIITLAKSLDLKLIAEGVETKNQLDILAANGCYEIQGYLFSPAITNKKFERYLIKSVMLTT